MQPHKYALIVVGYWADWWCKCQDFCSRGEIGANQHHEAVAWEGANPNLAAQKSLPHMINLLCMVLAVALLVSRKRPGLVLDQSVKKCLEMR